VERGEVAPTNEVNLEYRRLMVQLAAEIGAKLELSVAVSANRGWRRALTLLHRRGGAERPATSGAAD
jgi:hypothetical protein